MNQLVLQLLLLLHAAVNRAESICSTGTCRPNLLFSTPFLTSASSNFNEHIEGINASPTGKIYAVQYGSSSNVVGQIYPQQISLYEDKFPDSYFNGMHFLNKTTAFLVDSSDKKRLVKIRTNRDEQVVSSETHCSHRDMLPLNDLAVSFRTGHIFVSAMNWTNTSSSRDGQIWMCTRTGSPIPLDIMGGVNGIELSFDEKSLFATESFTKNWIHVSSKIWKYDVDVESGRISNKRVFADMKFIENDSVGWALDGIKTDSAGHLLVTRYGGSVVDVFSSSGHLISRIMLNFKNPSNLELVRISGKNWLFICGACLTGDNKGCVDVIQWPWQGRSLQYFRK